MDEKQLINMPNWDAGDVCVICGSPYVHRHHIFMGSTRKVADKYKYIIPLCPLHHSMFHEKRLKGIEKVWKERAQKHYEKHYGSREDFISEFIRSEL